MDTLNGLTQMNQVPVDMTLDGLAALRRREVVDRIAMQDAQRKLQQETTMDPLRVRQQQLSNDLTLQQVAQATRNNREADFVSPVKMLSDYKGYLAKAGDDDIKLATQQAQQMAFSQDPSVAERGRALLGATKEFLLQRQKDVADLDKVKQQGRDQRQLMQMQIDAGRFAKANKFGMSFTQQLSFENDPVKKLTLIRSGMAQAKDDPELQAMLPLLQEMERQIRPIAERKLSAGAQRPGAVDIQQLTNGGVPTAPDMSLTPPGTPAASDPYAGFSISRK